MVRSGSFALLPSLLFVTGCPAGEPTEATVSKVEARLAKDPCLHNIKAMRRTYQFAQRGWKIDPNRIDVAIQEAGHRGWPAGRFIVSPRAQRLIDDSQFYGANATYVVSTGQLD